MSGFYGENFMLPTLAARKLYHDYAKEMPIFDYHNHLPIQEIYEDKRYDTITELWLNDDHYKWRAMRVAGIPEQYITGSASALDKFKMWGRTVEKLIGCPLYYWTHLELNRYFGIAEPLTEGSAESIFHRANEMLKTPEYSARALLRRMNVRALCTTDDPADDLALHLKLKDEDMGFKVLPAFRPDSALNIAAPDFASYMERLGRSAGIAVTSMDSLFQALNACMNRFERAGCLLSDHGFVDFGYTLDHSQAQTALERALSGQPVSEAQALSYKSALLDFLAGEYTRRNWGMQIHTGAMRNTNSRGRRETGFVNGYDSVGAATDPHQLAVFFNQLYEHHMLPNTVLYSLNPVDNPMLATMAVNFCDGEIPGKVQLGSGWWFNDTVRGIERQLDEAIENGLLGSFVGMLTDSRSFTAFTRHEFFRRILCRKLGQLIEDGEYPAEQMDAVGRMVQDICFNNAARFFHLQ